MVTEINGMYFNAGVKMWLQLMCCALAVRTSCLGFQRENKIERKLTEIEWV